MVAKKLSTGMVQVYTGNGKGKTTAALGLALRAIGHGLRVCLIQFMKGDPDYGELRAARDLPNLVIRQFGRTDFVDRDDPDPVDIELAHEGLTHAREVIASGQYDIVILDEINVAVDFKLVRPSEVLALIEGKPKKLELVLTGRYAPEEFLQAADLVTEMREIKHYYQKGQERRDGIEH